MDTTFQGFRVGRDGVPWASAPEDRTAPNDGITRHPNPPWLSSRCRESNGLPSGPAYVVSVSRGRRLIHTPGTPWRCQTQQRATQSATDLHSSSNVLAMAPVACQPQYPRACLDHGRIVGHRKQPTTVHAYGPKRRPAQNKRQRIDRIRRSLPQAPHSTLAVRPRGTLPCPPRPERDGGGWVRRCAWIGEQDSRHIAGRLVIQ